MTVNRNTFASGTDGSAPSNPLASGDGYAFVSTTSAQSFSAANAPIGKMCLLTTNGAATGFVRPSGLSTSGVAAHLYFKCVGSVPTSDTYLVRLESGGTRYASVHINAAGKLRLSDAAGTTGVWTAATALTAGHWYRLEVIFISGSTTSNGTLKVDYYDCGTEDAFIDTTTPVETGYSHTDANVGAAVTFDNLYLGKYSSTAFSIAYKDPAFSTDATGAYIGPYVPAAADTALPLSLRSNAGGYTVTGSGVSRAGSLQDGSTSTGLTSLGSAADESAVVQMGALSAKSIVKVHYTAALPSGSTATKAKIRLMQGATEIATETRTTTDATNPLSTTPTAYVMQLSSGQASAITDRSALRLELLSNAS